MIRVRRMTYFIVAITFVPLLLLTWHLTAADRYETAAYEVVQADGKFEIREYPELTVAMTSMKPYGNGSDGSFMRLFGYISGKNESKQKIAMTTPVFMEPKTDASAGQMAFVLPAEVAASSAPIPADDAVGVEKRPAGKYAVLRFNGRMSREAVQGAESRLRAWMAENDLKGQSEIEFAGYDPPWTPGPLRRNEVLIRLNQLEP